MKNPDITFSVRAKVNTAQNDMHQKNDCGTLQFDVAGIPIMMMKSQANAFKGLCIVEASRNEYFGGVNSKNYRSDVVSDPSWMELWCLCSSQAAETRNF